MAHRAISRRRILQAGFLGGLGLTLSDLLRLTAGSERQAKAEACIFLHLKGGPSHLDTLDMKPDAPSEERGEFRSIATVLPGYEVCEHLPKLAQRMDRFTLIRGISHAAGAHPLANEYLFTGNRPSPAVVYPSLGSVCAKELGTDEALPPFVAIPQSDMSPGYLGVGFGSFRTTTVPAPGKPFDVRGLAMTGSLTLEKIQSRSALLHDLDQTFRAADVQNPVLEGLDRFTRQADAMIRSERTRQAFDISLESPAILQLFQNDPASQACLLAGRLVEHGIRFVTVTHDGWDTHLDNFNVQKNKLLPAFDASLTALIEMLEQKGLLERVLVIATGEFGRTPTINKQAGRDHWPRTMWTLVAGGGTKRAHFIGGTDHKGHAPNDDTQLKPDDLAATIYHALGIDPLREYLTPNGRPVTLVPEGHVIDDLFA